MSTSQGFARPLGEVYRATLGRTLAGRGVALRKRPARSPFAHGLPRYHISDQVADLEVTPLATSFELFGEYGCIGILNTLHFGDAKVVVMWIEAVDLEGHHGGVDCVEGE